MHICLVSCDCYCVKSDTNLATLRAVEDPLFMLDNIFDIVFLSSLVIALAKVGARITFMWSLLLPSNVFDSDFVRPSAFMSPVGQ